MAEAERLADVLREALKVDPPHASGDDLARSLSVEVCEAELPGGIVGSLDPILGRILVAPNVRPARRQFTICHELAEMHLSERLPEEVHERFCQRSAAAMLMPRHAFVRSLQEHGLDLLALRMRWIHCSMEAIASRVSDLVPGIVSCAWDELRPRWRRPSAGFEEPQALHGIEWEALGDAYHLPRGLGVVDREGVCARVWRTSAMAPRRALAIVSVAAQAPPWLTGVPVREAAD